MLYLNDIPASDVGVIVEHRPRRPVPRRKSYAWDVPGRGRILRQLDAWENVTLQYDLAVLPLPGTSLEATVDLAVSWLSQGGYMRLWDDTDPLVYYLAAFPGGADFESVLHRARRARLSFDARPERFLLSGSEPFVLSGSGAVVNPTAYSAKPLITLRGSGSGAIQVAGLSFSASNVSGLVIDSEAQQTTGPSATVQGSWPQLIPGSNTITFSGGVTSLEIVPRWFEI